VSNGTYENDFREHRPDSAAACECRPERDIPADATVCVFMGSDYKLNAEAAHAVVDVAERMRDAARRYTSWFSAASGTHSPGSISQIPSP